MKTHLTAAADDRLCHPLSYRFPSLGHVFIAHHEECHPLPKADAGHGRQPLIVQVKPFQELDDGGIQILGWAGVPPPVDLGTEHMHQGDQMMTPMMIIQNNRKRPPN